jgi:hypothetical protein
MSLSLSAGGDTYTLPGGAIILNDKQDMRHAMVPVTGQRGVSIRNDGSSETPKQLSVAFVIREADNADLITELNSLNAVLGRSGKMLLTDGLLLRHCWCRLAGVNADRVRRNYQMGFTLNLIVPDGTWFSALVGRNYAAESGITTASITASDNGTTVIHVNPNHTGTAPVRPQLEFVVSGAAWTNPAFTWYGRNMVPNSDLSQHTTGVEPPDDWTFSQGTPEWIQHYGYEGHHAVEIKGHTTGGSEDIASVRTTIQDGIEYTLSFHALQLAGGSGDIDVTWNWLKEDATAGETASVDNFSTISSLLFNRYSVTRTAPNGASPCALIDLAFSSGTTGDIYLITDIQLEVVDTATEYQNTSDPRYKHVTVTRGGVSVPSGDTWVVDMQDGISRIWDGSTWDNDGGNWNGRVFDLHSGVNHIHVSTPTGSVAVATTVHAEELFF